MSQIHFMRWRKWYLLISSCVIIPGVISLAVFGLRSSIDFTGGSLLEVQVQDSAKVAEMTQANIQPTIGDAFDLSSVQSLGSKNVLLRGKSIDNAQKNVVLQKLSQKFGQLSEVRFETVGPTLGRELLQKAIIAAAIVAVMVIAYIGKQFHSLRYGVCAILAMFHDSLVLLGVFSLLGHFANVEVDVLFVTALLTTLSFSVHDTIIVFDRIRETTKKLPKVAPVEIMNAAVLQTLGRSVNNSLTIIIMLVTLVLLGGSTIRWFAVALLVGAITGTYSSTFTAVPLLLVWDDIAKWLKKKKVRQD